MIHRIISSTLQSFKNIEDFKPGLNVLLAQKVEEATEKQTRNGAGKTSFIELVHFLLGANTGKDSIFQTKALDEHSFRMEFDLKSKHTVVERRCGKKTPIFVIDPSDVRLELTATDWGTRLGEEMFGLQSLEKAGSKPPSFRTLFSYFVRRQANGAFMVPEKHSTHQQNDDMQTALMFLLGLDWQIARDWQTVRDRERSLDELKKAASNGSFSCIIGKTADLRTEMSIKEDRLKKLRLEIDTFNILPEYQELEIESDKLTRQLNELANANIIDLSAIRDLESALESENPPNHEDLQAVYQEAGVVLPGLVKQRYEAVKSFHESVVRNRKDYLSSELESAKLRIERRNSEKIELDKRRGEIMRILKSHGALEQFTNLQSELGRLESEVESLRQRFKAAEKLESGKNELKIERNQLTIRLRRNFDEQAERLAEAIVAFENTSKLLYESAGSMTIDDTSNGPKFKFPMQGERSKGIKNMQIFCFDMMLMRLCAKRNIGPGFLIHDSHLFDGVDGRQIISALRVGSEIAQELGFQYIVTINEDDATKETNQGFNLQDFVLAQRLTDATEDGGLFGIRF